MTVLDTRDPYIQYTGTGSRRYFEYGFAWNGETVVVEVDGVPVSFEYQAEGVYLDVAPALDAEIVIWRETDITQERDFTAFDAFKGSWTEDALDKLILLKQEAAIWRAQTNLRANHQLDRVTIENTQGTDPDIFLWNLDQSGVFAGEVTTQMPAVGQVVAKPWDFAYFQYDSFYTGGFRDYEVIYLASSDQTTRAIGVDYVNQTYTEFGSFFSGEVAIDIDRTNTFLFRPAGIPATKINQYVWRGTCFSLIYSEDLGWGNGIEQLRTFKDLDQIVVIGVNAFGHGLAVVDYEVAAPFDMSIAYSKTPAGDFWDGIFDLRFGNNGLAEKGDAWITQPENGNNLTTYKVEGGVLVEVDQLSASSQGVATAWGWDRDTGILASHVVSAASFTAYQVDMSDLSISSIGLLSATDHAVLGVSPVPGETDMFITCEDVGVNDYVRTYRNSGGTLTKLDELALVGTAPNTSAHFRISPYTKRIWLLSQNQCNAYQVDADGNITLLVDLPYGTGSSGDTSNFIAFSPDEDGLYTTPNGFTGIKAKLYEHWSMDEIGSVTRVGSMGNADAYVVVGTVPDRTGTISNAADFDGASILTVSEAGLAPATSQYTTLELMTQGSFSCCLDFVVDDLSDQRTLFTRGRNSAGINPEDWDFTCYITTGGDLVFKVYVNDTDTNYSVTSTISISTATKYHVYVEYDRILNRIGVRVDNETLVTANLAATDYINLWANTTSQRFTIGRRTSSGGIEGFFDGYIDEMYWFWDTLTAAEQDFMYNGGSSRSFGEL